MGATYVERVVLDSVGQLDFEAAVHRPVFHHHDELFSVSKSVKFVCKILQVWCLCPHWYVSLGVIKFLSESLRTWNVAVWDLIAVTKKF